MAIADLPQNSIYSTLVNWEINHLPPNWAKSYQWVRLKPEIDNFVQFIIKAVAIDTVNTNHLLINVNDNIRQFKKTFGKSTIPEWSYQKGDRIRFIKFKDPASSDKFLNFTTIIDKEIIDIRHNGFQDIINDSYGLSKATKEASDNPSDAVSKNKAAAFAALKEKTFGSFVIEKFDVFDFTSSNVSTLDPLTVSNQAVVIATAINAIAGTFGVGFMVQSIVALTNAQTVNGSINTPSALADAQIALNAANILNGLAVGIGNQSLISQTLSLVAVSTSLVNSLSPTSTVNQYYNEWTDFTDGTLVVEVYRPKKIFENQLFYEFGQIYPIIGGYHGGQYQNQDANQPALGIMTRGNCFLSNRFMGSPQSYNIDVEDFNYSDFYISPCGDYGRPSAIIEQMERKRFPTKIRHGEKILDFTNINRSNQFLPLSDRTKILPLKYGEITGINEVGYTLKVIMSNKIDSIDIQRQQLMAGSGNSSLFIVKELIGSERPTENEYGSSHPLSIAINHRYVYLWDNFNACVVRDSNNGSIPISGDLLAGQDQYLMIGHFKKIADLLATYDNSEVIGVYDRVFESYILSFRGILNVLQVGDTLVNYNYLFTEPVLVQEFNNDRELVSEYYYTVDSEHVLVPPDDVYINKDSTYVAKIPIETIVFSEGKNKWVCKLNQFPEMFGSVGQNLVSFENGQLWKHYSNPIHGSFYGVKYPQKVSVVSNINPKSPKIFRNLMLLTNLNKPDVGTWKAKITTPANAQNTIGQETRILEVNFDNQEGNLYAEIPCDINSVGGIIDGEDIRDNVAIIELENNSPDEVNLSAVQINSILSE